MFVLDVLLIFSLDDEINTLIRQVYRSCVLPEKSFRGANTYIVLYKHICLSINFIDNGI